MKTSLLSAAVAALGLVGGCASSGHAPSSNTSNAQNNADFANNSNSIDNSRAVSFNDPRRGEPLNLSNRARIAQPQPMGNPLVLAAGITLANAYATDDSFAAFLDSSFGLAVFPVISNSGNDNFGSFNRGLVFQGGSLVGESTTEATPGENGQAFSQIVFFETAAAFNSFRASGFDLPEGIPTFPIVNGAADWARYTNGYAVFTTAGTSNDEFAPAGGQSFTFFDFAE